MSRNKYLLILVLLGLIGLAYAAQVDTAWTRRYDGPANSTEYPRAVAVDGAGNVYVTGSSWGINYDYATIKYNSAGDTLWLRRYNGPGNNKDVAYTLAVDGAGNVYVTGQSKNAGGNYDLVTIKYTPDGDTTVAAGGWVQIYDGPPGNDDDIAYAIALRSDTVYVTGQSWGSGTGSDYVTIKYTPDGDTAVANGGWVQRYNGPAGNSTDCANALAVDGTGNVYVTGNSKNAGGNYDYATIKYTPTGDTAVANGGWVQRYDGPGNSDDYAYALKVDGTGNVYVTGKSKNAGGNYDYATIKYTTAGDTTVAAGGWVQRYDGPANGTDVANALAVRADTVYVTGQSAGIGTGSYDYATIKYTPAGDTTGLGWVRRYNGPVNSTDCAYALAVDGAGNVYVTGQSPSTTDYDYATIKYNSAGDSLWVARYDGPESGPDYAYALAVDGTGNVYVTGQSLTSATTYDYLTIKYFQSYTITATAGADGSIDPSGAVVVNQGDDTTFTITPNTGCHRLSILVDGEPVTVAPTYTFENVTADHTIHATFGIDSFTITATATTGGTITPSGPVVVNYGSDTTFTITPDGGYQVADVLIDGVSVGAETLYTFVNVTADHTIDATFNIPGWAQQESMPTGIAGKYVADGGALVKVGGTKAGDVLYAFRGKSREFYKYDGSWTYLASDSIPNGKKVTNPTKINKKVVAKGASMCYDGNNIIYATKGNGVPEFWAYYIDTVIGPAGETLIGWKAKAFVPVPKGLKGGTSIRWYAGKVYLLAGNQKKTDPNNFYVYDPTADTTGGTPWTALASLPVLSGTKQVVWKDGSSIIEVGGTFYALKANIKPNRVFSYDMGLNTWNELTADTIPPFEHLLTNGVSKLKKLYLKDGAASATDGVSIYATKGGGFNFMWEYTPGIGWVSVDSVPRLNKKSVIKTGSAMAYADGGIWLLKGNKTPEFWKYIPSASVATSVIPSTTTSAMVERTTTATSFNFNVTPNPFTTITTIRYTVPVSGKVSVKLYNAIGNVVETVTNEYLNAGTYTTRLSANTLAKGIYFLKYSDATNTSEVKLIVQ